MRWAATALVWGVAAYVAWHNQQGGEVLALVGLDRVVGPDPHAQGALSVKLLVAIGVFSAATNIWRTRRERSEDSD